MKSAEVRKGYLEFFRGKGHTIVPSASLMPTSPNLLFTNAGMNQFVPIFLGQAKFPHSPARAADTQKCIRAGGKHNDLEDVGFDTYHHTFFEMLGNWSFGDYFKKESIDWAWELLVGIWKFPPERLYATVYQPGPKDPAEFDSEAHGYWVEKFKSVGLDPKIHVVMGGAKDNFWMMGETGPCGPCSEVHVDLTADGKTQGKLVNQGDPRCLEIWNLVFIQFNAEPGGKFKPLPERHVDTGMGLERVAGILATTDGFQDFRKDPSNYASDLFSPIFAKIQQISGVSYGAKVPRSREEVKPEEMNDCIFRVLADHVRTLSFSIADGIVPGNEGRNYVLRRILRRAVMFGKRLKLPDGFLTELATPVIETMGGVFPELRAREKEIRSVLSGEEASFSKTLERGLAMFEKLAAGSGKGIKGEDAFTLYDTYGFPLDLTQLLARERGIGVDADGFEKAMEGQRQKQMVQDTLADALIESAWEEWTTMPALCSVNGRDTFREIQDRLIRLAPVDGEFLVQLVRTKSVKYGLQLHILPIELLDDKLDKELDGGARIRMGVEVDATGKVLAYHLRQLDTTRGYLAGTVNGSRNVRVPASEIIHGFDRLWPDQLRGFTWMAQSMLRMRNLYGFEDAAVVNARVAASKMGFFTKDADGQPYSPNDLDASGNLISSAEPGSFEELPAGMKFETWQPEFPTAMHAEFVKTTLRGIASGLGVSYNMLANDLEGVNYSSIRAGLLDEREQWKLRQQWFIETFLRPVFSVWLEQALVMGDINLPLRKLDRFNSPVFVGRRWGWVDPKNDVEAKAAEIAAGMNTLTQVVAENGWDLNELLRERQREILLAEKLGVPVVLVKQTQAPAPANDPNTSNGG